MSRKLRRPDRVGGGSIKDNVPGVPGMPMAELVDWVGSAARALVRRGTNLDDSLFVVLHESRRHPREKVDRQNEWQRTWPGGMWSLVCISRREADQMEALNFIDWSTIIHRPLAATEGIQEPHLVRVVLQAAFTAGLLVNIDLQEPPPSAPLPTSLRERLEMGLLPLGPLQDVISALARSLAQQGHRMDQVLFMALHESERNASPYPPGTEHFVESTVGRWSVLCLARHEADRIRTVSSIDWSDVEAVPLEPESYVKPERVRLVVVWGSAAAMSLYAEMHEPSVGMIN